MNNSLAQETQTHGSKSRLAPKFLYSLIASMFVFGLSLQLIPAQSSSAATVKSPTPDFISKISTYDNYNFNYPNSIAVDNSGNKYIIDDDQTNGAIIKLDANNNMAAAWGSEGSGNGQFCLAQDIEVGPNGNIYVADFCNNRIQIFTPTGNFVSKFGTEGTGNGQFSAPSGIDFDSSGNIFVSDFDNDRIQKFDSSGAYVSQFGVQGNGNGQLSYPRDIAIDSADNVYVTDSFNSRVQKFDSSGQFVSKIGTQGGAVDGSGSGNGQFAYPKGIIADAQDNIYVVDVNNNRVQKFNSSGAYVGKFGTAGSGNGKFKEANGIAIDSSNNIYVADSGNKRIQKFAYLNNTDLTSSNPDGSSTNVVLKTPLEATVTCSNTLAENSLENKDPNFTYPLGFTNFCLDVPNASTQIINLTYETALTPDQVVARKYDSDKGTFANIPDAVITDETIDGKHFLRLTYSVTDGGALDADGVVNGEILDPASLGVTEVPEDKDPNAGNENGAGNGTAGGNLPTTGSYALNSLLIGAGLITVGGLGVVVLKKFKLKSATNDIL
jgi:DNA-binding beta-propeller fold protein YncE